MDDKTAMHATNGHVQISAYEALLGILQDEGIRFRLVEHEPEGRTDVISQIRGNHLSQAAKAMVVRAKFGKHIEKYFLVVVPGDYRLDFSAISKAVCADRILMAPPERAVELSGAPIGGVPPFSFNPNLSLIVDPRLLEETEIVFNAGRLDASVFIHSDDYVRIAKPQIARVGQPPAPMSS